MEKERGMIIIGIEMHCSFYSIIFRFYISLSTQIVLFRVIVAAVFLHSISDIEVKL